MVFFQAVGWVKDFDFLRSKKRKSQFDTITESVTLHGNDICKDENPCINVQCSILYENPCINVQCSIL